MNLLDLQRQMSQDVRRPLTEDFQMQAATEQGLPMSEVAASYVKPNPLLTSFERLEIYNRQYWFRVISAVSEDFPALNAVLGPKKFDALVLAYLQANPSTSFTLRNLGARLPDWLALYPQFAGSRHSLAVDVARLEWAYIESFDSASMRPMSLHEFSGLGADSTLHLQPHLQLLDLRYPVDEIILAVRKATPKVDIVSNAVAERKKTSRVFLPKMRRSSVYLAIHRLDDCVYYRRIDREEFLLLAGLRDGYSIATSIGNAFEHSKLAPEKVAEKTQEYFSHASALGWFCLPEPASRSILRKANPGRISTSRPSPLPAALASKR